MHWSPSAGPQVHSMSRSLRLFSSVASLFEDARSVRDGSLAEFLPQLRYVDPESFGLGLTTVQGQRLALGDARTPITLQACCEPVNDALAREAVAADPALALDLDPVDPRLKPLDQAGQGRGLAPDLSAEALIDCGRIGPGGSLGGRLGRILDRWSLATGGVRPELHRPTYRAQREAAECSYAGAQVSRAAVAFQESADLLAAFELYQQCCALELSADDLGVAAATLANAGVCPTTNAVVFSPAAVRGTLERLSAHGPGPRPCTWPLDTGLPAKGGASGALLVIVPGVLGACIWSPRLEGRGLSARGVAFCASLVEALDLPSHNRSGLPTRPS